MGCKQVDEHRRLSPLVNGVIPSQLAALVYLTAVALVADISGISAAAQLTHKSGNACEGLKLSLKCQPGEVIRIHLANYGRFTLTVCNDRGQTDGWDLQCRTPRAKDIVSERCDGRRTCEVPADSNVFPEPCPGTYKYLEVKYRCERDRSHRPPVITSVTALNATAVKVVWTQEEPVETTMLYHKKIGETRELKPIFVHWATKSYVIGQLSPDTTYNFMVKTFSKHPTRPASSQQVVLKTPADETTTHKPGPDVHDPHKPVPTVKLYPTTTTSPTTTPQSLRREPTSHAAALPDFEHTMKPPEEIYEPTVKPTNEWIPSREYIPKPDHGNEVVDKFCEVTVHDGITWPRTKDGKIEEKSCPFHLKGTSTWRCLNYGWENSGPDMSKCSSSWLEELS